MFNLLELLLVSTLIIALSGGHTYLMPLSQLSCQQQVEDVIAVFSYAREQAMLRSMRVTVQALETQQHVADWRKGIQIILHPADTKPVLLLKHRWAHPFQKLEFNAYPQNAELSFLANGMTDYQNGTWTLHDTNGRQVCFFRILISQTGRIHVVD